MDVLIKQINQQGISINQSASWDNFLVFKQKYESWKINFFEGVPSPASAGLVLLPLILSLIETMFRIALFNGTCLCKQMM